MKNLAIGFIAIGIIMMIVTGFNFVTHENVVDLGPIQINRNEYHPVQWSPIIGGVLLVSGILLLVTGRFKSTS
ncbi:MAG: hypothetical protein LH473_01410 [Chitinophagales bacterium]|nr:hypothetical protein [Chitinophagales bacterium]